MNRQSWPGDIRRGTKILHRRVLLLILFCFPKKCRLRWILWFPEEGFNFGHVPAIREGLETTKVVYVVEMIPLIHWNLWNNEKTRLLYLLSSSLDRRYYKEKGEVFLDTVLKAKTCVLPSRGAVGFYWCSSERVHHVCNKEYNEDMKTGFIWPSHKPAELLKNITVSVRGTKTIVNSMKPIQPRRMRS